MVYKRENLINKKFKKDFINKELIVGSLDDADNYYCIFKIADITNNYHYSKLIKIGG